MLLVSTQHLRQEEYLSPGYSLVTVRLIEIEPRCVELMLNIDN